MLSWDKSEALFGLQQDSRRAWPRCSQAPGATLLPAAHMIQDSRGACIPHWTWLAAVLVWPGWPLQAFWQGLWHVEGLQQRTLWTAWRAHPAAWSAPQALSLLVSGGPLLSQAQHGAVRDDAACCNCRLRQLQPPRPPAQQYSATCSQVVPGTVRSCQGCSQTAGCAGWASAHAPSAPPQPGAACHGAGRGDAGPCQRGLGGGPDGSSRSPNVGARRLGAEGRAGLGR